MLIREGTVLTVDSGFRILEPGWIRVRGNTIAEVSSRPIVPKQDEEIIEAGGRLVLPGLVNTHTHLFQTLLRGVYEERPLPVYLDYIYRSGLELTREDARLSAMLGSLESIRAGTTTIVDHHFLNRIPELAQATIEGMREVGVRAVLARTIMDMGDTLPQAILERPSEGLRQVEALLDRYLEHRRDRTVTIMTGPNTPGMNASAEAVRATRRFADEHGIRLSAHVAEYKGVVDSVRSKYGVDGVVRWLDSLGALGPDLLAVHAVQVDAEEVGMLGRRRTPISHNPYSNLFCADRNAPVSDYLRENLDVGLGTDGAANNNAQGVLDALRMTRLLQRAHPRDPTAITPEIAIRMATIDGARAIGLADVVGSIEAGKRADLAIVDIEELPHTVPTHDLVVQLVHSVKPSDVRSTIVDGRVVMRDRIVQSVDEPSVLQAARAAAKDLVRRLG